MLGFELAILIKTFKIRTLKFFSGILSYCIDHMNDFLTPVWVSMCVTRELFLGETLNASITWMIFLTCVGFHVCYQITFMAESLAALMTWMIFLLCGFLCVLPDYFLGWNSYCIDHINNFSLLCWFSCVLPEYFLGETLSTLITWMIFPSCVGFHAA